MTGRTGRVRVARLTDLAALGELSRLCQQEAAETRSLGLPVSGPRIGVFSLFRLPSARSGRTTCCSCTRPKTGCPG